MLEKLTDALKTVIDPDIRRPITDLGMISGLILDESGTAKATLHLTIATCHAAETLEQETISALESVPEVKKVDLTVAVMTPEERAEFITRVKGPGKARQFTEDSLTRVIAVTSGKGGVGKSTLTANLAVAMAETGLKVGLIDADIFGFSIPGLLGLTRQGVVTSPIRINDMIVAPEAHGVRVISIGMFLGEEDGRNTAVSWRGPMLHRTIEQFLQDVWFGDLDVLLLDLPPGTGDVALSVGQLLPQAETIVVTTPQTSASDVAVRSGILSLSSGHKILGVVENMGPMQLPDGSFLDIFGSGGGNEVAARLTEHPKNAAHNQIENLGTVPLSPSFRSFADDGIPAITASPEDPASVAINSIVTKIIGKRESLRGTQLPLSFS